MKRFFPISIVRVSIAVIAILLVGASQAYAQAQLSLVDIVTALRSKKATSVEKNQILAEGVSQRGVTFALNGELEKELRTAGANDQLIAAIRSKGPAPESKPQPTATPIPVSTPKPPDASYYKNRGNANFVMGEYDAAVADYSKAIEMSPADSTTYFSRGMAYFNKKNFIPAIGDFDKVIELDPSESMAYFNRGVALENTGKFEKALEDLKKAVELDADNEPAKNALARVEAKIPRPVPTVPAQTPATVAQQTVPEEKKPKVDPAPTSDEPFDAGSLREQALKLAVPSYPVIERQNRTEGIVTVQVTLDESGKVMSAKATNGPKGLRNASEDAAKRSKFKPVTVGGKPVRATGTVVYNFKLS